MAKAPANNKTANGKMQDIAARSKRRTAAIFKDLRGGRSLSLEFFKKNGWLLSIIFIIVLSLMGLKYRTQTRMIEIKKLNKELAVSESEKLARKQDYMTLIRQTKMNQLVAEHHLGLIHQEQPPYEIVTDADSQNKTSQGDTLESVTDETKQ